MKVFSHLIKTSALSLTPQTDGVQQWLYKLYTQLQTLLFTLTDASYIDLLMDLVKAESAQLSPDTLYLHNDMFHKVVKAALEHSGDVLIKLLKIANTFPDVLLLTYKNLAKCMELELVTMETAYTVLSTLHNPDELELNGSCKFILQQGWSYDELMKSKGKKRDEDGAPVESGHYRKLTKSFPMRFYYLSAYRTEYSDCWIRMLSNKLPKSIIKSIMTSMRTDIIVHLERPERLFDMLLAVYDLGKSLSILALESIFYLMTERSLEFTDFYPRLYTLLTQDLLQSKHIGRFLLLLDVFLSSR